MISRACLSARPPHARRAMCPAWLTGACNPMLCPIHVRRHQLNWGCPHKGAPWPGSSDQKCIGAAMQPNTFQGENGAFWSFDPRTIVGYARLGQGVGCHGCHGRDLALFYNARARVVVLLSVQVVSSFLVICLRLVRSPRRRRQSRRPDLGDPARHGGLGAGHAHVFRR